MNTKRLERLTSRLVEFAATLPQPREKSRHRLILGAALAAPAVPLIHGAAKLAQAAYAPLIGRVLGKVAPEVGKRIASPGARIGAYIEGAQIATNRGLGGKVAGAILKRPKSDLGKLLVPNQEARSHYSSFRASHREALDSTLGETLHAIRSKKNIPTKIRDRLVDKHMKESVALLDNFDDLTANKGYNHAEAFRRVTSDPQHNDVLRRGLPKIDHAKQYAQIAAGTALAPLAVGGAVAATKKRAEKRK